MPDLDDYVSEWIDGLRLVGRCQKLFITGCPKSGTTWLTKLLDAHPGIVANGEGRFAHRLFGCIRQAVDSFNGDHRAVGGQPIGLVTDGDYTMMLRIAADNVLLRYLAASGKSPAAVRVVADKTPQHVLHHQLLSTLYPGCRFINIVRDPRDAVTSALFHLAKTDPRPAREYVESFIGETWRLHVEAALDAERRLGPGTFLNVRYESLHADPDPIIRRCLSHLNVDASDDAVTTCRNGGSFERLSGGRQRGQTDNTAFYRNGQVGDWRNHLPEEVARAACAPVADLMRRFGYTFPEPAPQRQWLPNVVTSPVESNEYALVAR